AEEPDHVVAPLGRAGELDGRVAPQGRLGAHQPAARRFPVVLEELLRGSDGPGYAVDAARLLSRQRLVLAFARMIGALGDAGEGEDAVVGNPQRLSEATDRGRGEARLHTLCELELVVAPEAQDACSGHRLRSTGRDETPDGH